MLKRLLLRLVSALGALALASCAAIEPQDYAGEQPALDMKQYFNGTLVGHGLFMDRSGRVARRFVVTIRASWEGDTGTLDEDFVWSDGERKSASGPSAPSPARPAAGAAPLPTSRARPPASSPAMR